jgi:hypothetical protein
MAIQFVAREEFLLSFGIVTPPLLLGEPEQVAAQAQQITFVEVKPVARVGFNRQRTEELIRLLQENLANHDRLFGEEETP